MKVNVMNTITLTPSKMMSSNDMKILIFETCKKLLEPCVYSYIVISDENNYVIKFNINDNDKYNTILLIDAVHDICSSLDKDDGKIIGVICFGQPNVDVMIEVYDNFIKSTSIKLCYKWNLEYDDVYQTCALALLKCVKKKYYIHKQLLLRAFNNDILMLMRKRKGVEFISFETLFRNDGDNDPLNSEDYFADLDDLNRRDDEENVELAKHILKDIKNRYKINDREYEQLLKEYGSKHTNEWSRSAIKRLKRKIMSDNIKISDYIGGKNG